MGWGFRGVREDAAWRWYYEGKRARWGEWACMICVGGEVAGTSGGAVGGG